MSGVLLALVSLAFAATFVWEIVDPVFGIGRHRSIHPFSFAYTLIATAAGTCAALQASLWLLEASSSARGVRPRRRKRRPGPRGL